MKALQVLPTSGSAGEPRRRPTALLGLGLAAAALLSGCTSAPQKSGAMVDSQADFSSYETFGLITDSGPSGSGAPVSLVDSNIRAAITAEMQRKGYVEVPEGAAPDLLIDYEAARVEKVKSRPLRIGIGVGSYGSGGGGSISTSTSGVRNVSEGSLVIHAVDPARNSEVWRSRISRELGKNGATAEVVQSVVAEVFNDFPARSATP